MKISSLKKNREFHSQLHAARTMGQRIKILRCREQLTQRQLGKLLGVTPQAVCLWESGITASIRAEVFIRLVKTFDIDYVFLCWGDEGMPPLDDDVTL
jgi:transcriptional regulator with XRE-family HTH domain